jgi:hypothetical protein
LDTVYPDPLDAINGLFTDMRPFLDAKLKDVRAVGIGLAPAPVRIVDPTLENRVAYNLDVAIRFAMLVAPALTVSLRQDKNAQQTQLCIPVLTGRGLDALGMTVAESGELLLRAFMLVVHRVLIESLSAAERDPLTLFARTHKAETVEIGGQRWHSKACNSDREAVGICNTLLRGSKHTQVYCYLGGGGLTDASASYADLSQGVVCKTKTWRQCAAVCVAVALLTAAVPGPTAVLDEDFCSTDCPDEDDAEGGLPDLSAPGEGTTRVQGFMHEHNIQLMWLWNKLGYSLELLEKGRQKSVQEAKDAMEKLREFLRHDPGPRPTSPPIGLGLWQ